MKNNKKFRKLASSFKFKKSKKIDAYFLILQTVNNKPRQKVFVHKDSEI